MKKILKTIFITAIILYSAIANISLAATVGSFSISASSNSITTGKTTTLNITLTNCEGQFTISSSNPSIVSVSESLVWIDGSKSITLTAKSEGTATITVTATDVGDNQVNPQEVTGSKTTTITVSAPATPAPQESTQTQQSTPVPAVKSSNANLKNLGITPNDFSGFTAGKTEYYVTVPYEVESVNVYAKKAESSQTISGEGNKTLEIGATTRCAVTVTAEDGTQKTYNIYVTRKSEPTETIPNVVEEPEELLKLSTLEVKNATITPEFNPDVYEYAVELTDGNIEKLDILATANIENASIEVTGNENFMEGENTISIVLKSEDGTKAATYTITVTKGALATEEEIMPIDEEKEEQVQEEKKNIFSFLKSGNTGMVVALVIAIVVLLASIATVVVILVKNKKEANGEIMNFTPKSEYNVFEEKDKVEKIEIDEKPERRKGKHF